MFEKLAAKLKALSKPPASVDPATFGDPLALETSWEPLASGGTNFRTTRLVIVSPNCCRFRPTLGAMVFYLVFFVAGLGAMGMSAFFFTSADESMPWFGGLIPLGVGAVFTSVGGGLFYFGTRPIVFDRQFGWYYKGRGGPPMAYDESTQKTAARLIDIRALQIIREHCSGNDSSYYSYELNLVLGDATRLNVTDHGNVKCLREDAKQLAEFLDVPLWDAAETVS